MLIKLLGLDLIEAYIYPHEYDFDTWKNYDGKNIPTDLIEQLYLLSIRQLLIDKFHKQFKWIKYVSSYGVATKFQFRRRHLYNLINFCSREYLFINFEKPELGKTKIEEIENREILAKYPISHYNNFANGDGGDISIKNKTYSFKIKEHHKFFADHKQCVGCKIEPTHCLLVKETQTSASIKMAAQINGKYIPMTIDHIKPRSAGGKDNISNWQTMCKDCNRIKGNDKLTQTKIDKILATRRKNTT